MRAAIDFSITSTALVLRGPDGDRCYSFVPELKKGKPFAVHRTLADAGVLEVIEYGGRSRPTGYSEREIENHRAAARLAEKVADVVADAGAERVAFEGFSYASKGASFIDLIVFNSFCKAQIMRLTGLDVEVYSPGAIKAHYSGKGNTRKPEMYASFLDREQGAFRDAVLDAVGPYGGPDMKLPKPVDDLVDAHAIASLMDT